MPIPYKVVIKRPGGIGQECQPKYYPTVTKTKMIELKELCDIISERAVFNRAVIYGVTELLANLIPELLQKGHSIKFGDVGIFSLSIKGEGQDSPKDVNVRTIREVKVNFRSSPVLKERLRLAEFSKVK